MAWQRIIIRLGVASLVLGAIWIGASWISGAGIEEGRFVNDFRIFRGAGQLVANGNSASLFDRELLGAAAYREGERAVFLNPPPWAVLFVPFTLLDVPVGAVLWLVATAGLMVFGLRRLGAEWTWIAAAFLSMPALVNLELGQNSYLSTGLVALVVWALLEDRPGPAAVFLTLLFYKPYLAIGLFLAAWFGSKHMRRAALGAVVGWTALVAASFVMVPDVLTGWSDNWSFLRSVALQHESGPAGLVAGLGPDWLAGLLAVAAVVSGLVGIIWVLRNEVRPDVGLAAAALFGVWVSPHVLIYDWLVLVVPLVLIAAAVSREVAAVAAGVLAVAALVASPIESLQFDALGGWVGIGSLALIGTTMWVWRRLRPA